MSKETAVASIITIGDELLIGQVIDTNSAWIAQQLNAIGIWVKKRIAVGDIRNDIWNTLDEECKEVNLIILTGGLGPTADDITKPLLCDYFGGKLIIDHAVLEHVRYLSEVVYKRPFIERNAKQAEVPDVCTVLTNTRGSAPGMWFEKQGVIVISLPGVPYEMKGIFSEIVIPKLMDVFSGESIIHRTLITWGIGESFLAEKIKHWEQKLSADIKLAYLPNYGMVRLRLTAKGNDYPELERLIDHERNQLKLLVKEWLIAEEDLSLPQLIRKMLEERQKTIATAESCTGGFIAQLLTAEAGASLVYKGSVVSYSNNVKEKMLGVDVKDLKKFGAVSEEIVQQMVKGALKNINSDYAIATSGIMGPGGGTDTKPVGTVWIAVGNNNHIVSKKFHFRFDRAKNIEVTANNALLLMRSFILSGF